jgi:hypothetical protein
LNRCLTLAAALVSPLALIGCGGNVAEKELSTYNEAKLTTAEEAQAWALLSSAPMIYVFSTGPLANISLGLPSSRFEDPSCPKRGYKGDDYTVEGGCTDKDGTEYSGKATYRSSGSRGAGRYVFENFTQVAKDECGGNPVTTRSVFRGTVVVKASGDAITFESDVVMEAEGPGGISGDFFGDDEPEPENCEIVKGSMAWDYSGSFTGSILDRSTWKGSGRVGNSELGFVTAETKDQVIDREVCATEAASGTTTIKSGSDTVVITYDGAEECSFGTVKWSHNGTPMGELQGVMCSAASGVGLAGWMLVSLGALSLLRRSRRRS